MSVLRHVFLPERPRLLPALLTGAAVVALDVTWFITGSAWFGFAALPFVWISFRHVGLRYVDRITESGSPSKRKLEMLLMLLLSTPLGCGDDNPPQTLEQCIEVVRQEYWGCHKDWLPPEGACLRTLEFEQRACKTLFRGLDRSPKR